MEGAAVSEEDWLDTGSLFKNECLEVANKLEKLGMLEGCTLTKDGALAAMKAAMLLKEVVRGV
jgi:hypothetical protein